MTEEEIVGWHFNSIDMSLSKLQELVMDREDLRATIHGVAKHQIWLRWNYTDVPGQSKEEKDELRNGFPSLSSA